MKKNKIDNVLKKIGFWFVEEQVWKGLSESGSVWSEESVLM